MNGRLMKWERKMGASMAGVAAAGFATVCRKTASVVAVVLAVALTATLTVGCQSPEERCLSAVQKAVYQDNFQGGLAAIDQFYADYAEAKEPLSEEAMAQRWEISAYARLCLLMTGELNRRFLGYYPVREMGAMVPGPLPLVARHCYAYSRMYYEMGLYGPALSLLLFYTEEEGWNKETARLVFDIYIKTHQWRPAQTYWLAFKQNWRTRRWVKPYDEILSQVPVDSIDGTQMQPMDDRYLFGPQYKGGFMDDYVKALFEHELGQVVTGGDSTNNASASGAAMAAIDAASAANLNPYLTDYYTLICLLDKKMNQVPTLIKVYRAQNRLLPDYLQEAVLMYASTPDSAAALEAAGLTHEALQLNPEIEERVSRVLRDFEMLKIGSLPFEEMTKRHAATYTYHLLFGQMQ